jgi:hypothetical protein
LRAAAERVIVSRTRSRRVWDLISPSLPWSLPRDESRKKAWSIWFRDTPFGQRLLLFSLSTASQISDAKVPKGAKTSGVRVGAGIAVDLEMNLRTLAVAVFGILLELGCGSPGNGGRTCAQLQSDYEQALPPALACTPGATNQCQQAIPVTSCAGCNRYVNDATKLDAITTQLVNQGCVHCEGLDLCVQTGPYACVANDGGVSVGQCAIALPSGSGG